MSLEFFLLIIITCVSTDIGGYIFGKIFKGPKLTTISPNKTYAGMVGGYLLSLACLLIITNFIDYKMTPFRLFFITQKRSTCLIEGTRSRDLFSTSSFFSHALRADTVCDAICEARNRNSSRRVRQPSAATAHAQRSGRVICSGRWASAGGTSPIGV